MNVKIVEFKTEYPIGRDPVDWVLLAPMGDDYLKTQTWHRVRDLRPKDEVPDHQKDTPHYQLLVSRWEMVEPAYEAWKKNEDLPENGQPLAAWSGVTREQAAMLRRMGVRTVEDVAAMSADDAAAMRWPNSYRLPEMAKSYLAGADLAEKDAEIEAMRERMAAMEEMLAEQAKPKRGRPPKQKADAA